MVAQDKAEEKIYEQFEQKEIDNDLNRKLDSVQVKHPSTHIVREED